MIKKLGITFICFCTGVLLFAQNNDYFNLKDVKTFRFDHLELKTEKEIDQFIRNPEAFNFIEALKINETPRLNEILNSSNICSYIKELDLSAYKGDLNPQTFDSCGGIEILHISINEEKLEQLKYLSSIKNLNTVYLYIVGKPEDLSGLKYLPILKELHVIGEFLPKDLIKLFDYLEAQTFLYTLGISIDRITDLPQNVMRFKTLSKLNLYDNLSVYSNNGIYELNEEKLSIIFNLYSDMINAIGISYFSSNGNLADFEIAYLQNLYKGELVPQQFEQAEETINDLEVIPFKKDFIPDFSLSPEFHKPYPKISPAEEIFVINPNNSSVIYSNSGLKLTIAANSFVNDNNEDVKEPVYIKIIQLNTPTDLLFAGFDLKVGDNQLCNQFLFNIQATSEKGSAKLREGYQIKVNMPVTADSAKTYFFDYESNTWQDLDFYNQVFATNFTAIDFYKIESNTLSTSYFQYDTSSFKERFWGKKNIVLNDANNPNQMLFRKKQFYTDLDRTWLKDYNANGSLKGFKIKNGKSYIKIQKVIPKVRNKQRLYFKLLDKTEQKIFAELSAFKNINFNSIINPENKKEFNETYLKNIKYYDILIHYGSGKEFCEITLKTAEGFKKIKAYITDSEDKKTIKKQMLKFAKAYKSYQRIRAKREFEFNTLNKLRFEEFKTYTNSKLQLLQKNNKSTELKIHQLGTFGLMYTKKPEFTTNIIAQYTDESGLPIDIKEIYMIDSRYNTFFKIEVGNIAFDPLNCTCIVAVDYSGNLYFANKSDVAMSNLSNNSLIYIKLKKVNPGITSIPMFNHLIRN